MAKIKYYAAENKTVGTHSFYAVPVPNGTLTFDELVEEAMDGKSIEPSIARACVTEFMKAVKRNVLKGFRCNLGDNFLTVYPNIQLSVKDREENGQTIPATADMLTAANAKSRLGCTVASKFSREFADSVSWKKVDPGSSALAPDADDDITDPDTGGGGQDENGPGGGLVG